MKTEPKEKPECRCVSSINLPPNTFKDSPHLVGNCGCILVRKEKKQHQKHEGLCSLLQPCRPLSACSRFLSPLGVFTVLGSGKVMSLHEIALPAPFFFSTRGCPHAAKHNFTIYLKKLPPYSLYSGLTVPEILQAS